MLLVRNLVMEALAHRSPGLIVVVASLLLAALMGFAVGRGSSHGGLQWQRILSRHPNVPDHRRRGRESSTQSSSYIAQVEAIYNSSQQAALDLLAEHENLWASLDLWYLMGPFYNCISQRMGYSLDGGKWVCNAPKLLTHRGCVVYSIGSNGDVSFEIALLAKYPQCQMHTFDPTLSPEKTAKVNSTEGVTFHPQGIASEKAMATLSSNFTTFTRSMAELNIFWVDILKIDIEGGEWAVFLEILEEGLPMPFTQILIEIHTYGIHDDIGSVPDVLKRFFIGMHRAGYRIFAVEPNFLNPTQCLEYGFVKVDAFGNILQGP